jgi:hypothetical protein
MNSMNNQTLAVRYRPKDWRRFNRTRIYKNNIRKSNRNK